MKLLFIDGIIVKNILGEVNEKINIYSHRHNCLF